MGGPINKLTDLAIKNAKPGMSPRRIADGGGLFLEIRANGASIDGWCTGLRKNKNFLPLACIHRFPCQKREKVHGLPGSIPTLTANHS